MSVCVRKEGGRKRENVCCRKLEITRRTIGCNKTIHAVHFQLYITGDYCRDYWRLLETTVEITEDYCRLQLEITERLLESSGDNCLKVASYLPVSRITRWPAPSLTD